MCVPKDFRSDIMYIEDYVGSLRGCSFIRFMLLVAWHICTCFYCFQKKRHVAKIRIFPESTDESNPKTGVKTKSTKGGDNDLMVVTVETSAPVLSENGKVIGYECNSISSQPIEVVEEEDPYTDSYMKQVKEHEQTLEKLMKSYKEDPNSFDCEKFTTQEKLIDTIKREHFALSDWSRIKCVPSVLLFFVFLIGKGVEGVCFYFCCLCRRGIPHFSNGKPETRVTKIQNRVGETISSTMTSSFIEKQIK